MAAARRLINGRHLTLATINRPPFSSIKSSGKKIVSAEGFCFEILKEVARRLNFTYTMVESPDGSWGSRMPNGTFDGVIGMVQRQSVDFAVSGFTVNYLRSIVIDFSHPFYDESLTILIPAPRQENDVLAFLKPYSWQVWSATAGSVLVVGPLMWVLATAGTLPAVYPHNTRKARYSVLTYVWACAISLVSQSCRMRQTEPMRVLYGAWWTLALVLIYTYNSTLTSFLLVPRTTALISSLEQLADQRKVLWTLRAGTPFTDLVMSAHPPSTYYKIGRLVKERPDLLVQGDLPGASAVLQGGRVFIKEKSWLDFAIEADFLATNKCRLAQVNQLFYTTGFAWPFPKDSPFLQLFNHEILKLSQSGLLSAWKKQFWPRPNRCTSGKIAATSGPKELQLKNFTGHFLVLGVGVGLASLVLLVERSTAYTRRQLSVDAGDAVVVGWLISYRS
nr:glutamate receptor ionotropic, kainate glr-3-like isoform X1 [Procambarus clarkii]